MTHREEDGKLLRPTNRESITVLKTPPANKNVIGFKNQKQSLTWTQPLFSGPFLLRQSAALRETPKETVLVAVVSVAVGMLLWDVAPVWVVLCWTLGAQMGVSLSVTSLL